MDLRMKRKLREYQLREARNELMKGYALFTVVLVLFLTSGNL